ncbi:hypothetical protein SimranZ1_72 [Mycobacterium phage SimranZ1]|nr:hypothetical protein SimranZ1_72 [Mycobacterium phage SimranZ1]
MKTRLYQRFSGSIERANEDGPGGAGNTVAPGLTTGLEWL